MKRPLVEVADIFRAVASGFLDPRRTRFQQLKVIRAITGCRTERMGGHIDVCTGCGKQSESFNSCRDRHCPRCQAQARERWLAARQRELLPVPYFHVVFTLPHTLNTLIQLNPEPLFNLLFRTAADTLMEVAAHPKRLGADIGFLAILHTWTQRLTFHPHIHCVVPAGGLSFDQSRWIAGSPNYLLPEDVLGIVFRGKFSGALRKMFDQGRLRLPRRLQSLEEGKRFGAWLRTIHIRKWIVYAKPPFAGPAQVLRYLGRYTHRVAISNHRLVGFNGHHVWFRWRDRQHGNRERILRLSTYEFTRRFLLHVLPKGFVRIRYFGFMANFRRSASIALCRRLLRWTPPPEDTQPKVDSTWRCPDCQAPMKVWKRLTPIELALHRGFRLCTAFDTS